MKIWLDTIDEETIADALATGVLSGITTNPSILSQAKDIRRSLSRLLDIQPGPVAIQTIAQNSLDIVEEAKRLYTFSNRLIIKIPINRNGLIAIQKLRNKNIPILGTGIIFPTQALLAANLEVKYIAPYFSHMGETAAALQSLKTIVEMLRINKSQTQVLAASIKQVENIIDCSLLGIAGVTIKAELYHDLITDHSAVEGFMQKFKNDWVKAHGQHSILVQ